MIVSDLILSYNFDESSGTRAYDASGNETNGFLISVGRVPGEVGNAANFTILGSGIKTIDMPMGLSGEMSIEFWFMLPSISESKIYSILSAPYYQDLSLKIQNSKVTVYRDSITYLQSSSVIMPSSWYYIVVSLDGSSRKLYLNGSLIDSNVGAFPYDYRIGPYSIGANQNGDYFDNFTGVIDEFEWCSIPLSGDTVLSRYNSIK